MLNKRSHLQKAVIVWFHFLKRIYRDGKYISHSERLGGGANKGVTFGDEENVFELNSGDGYTPLWIH